MNWSFTLSPSRVLPDDDTRLVLSVSGSTVTICGEDLDLSALADGDVLPAEAVESPFIAGQISRFGDTIAMRLLFPHGANVTEAARFPVPITVTTDGPVALPEAD